MRGHGKGCTATSFKCCQGSPETTPDEGLACQGAGAAHSCLGIGWLAEVAGQWQEGHSAA